MIDVEQLKKDIVFYQFANGLPKEETAIIGLINRFDLSDDCPLLFIGLLYDFCSDKEFRYFNKEVSDEVCCILYDLYNSDKEKCKTGFHNGLESFFLALDSFFFEREKRYELSNVTFENNNKSTIYRVPMYVGVCENVLMNYYRFIASIISDVKNIDLASQNTLGKLIPSMRKYGFDKLIDIDINIRNAINHGRVLYNDNELVFSYIEDRKKSRKTITIWEFDDLIEKTYDIASGTIIGIIKFLSLCNDIIQTEFENIGNSEYKDEWFRLLYHSKMVHCVDIDTKKSQGQVNLQIKATIPNENNLGFIIRLLLSGLYVFYNDQEQFFICYQHPRSVTGFARFPKSDVEKILQFSNGTLPKLSDEKIYLINPVMDSTIDIRRHNYFQFPEMETDEWIIEDLIICSIKDAKRISGRLVLKKRIKKESVYKIVEEIISRLRYIDLPLNPKTEVIAGITELDALFLNVFLEPDKRGAYTLFINNPYFVCMANYYRSIQVPRLNHGNVPIQLWKKYKKVFSNNVEYAWNPSYRANSY
jgi:hypothetical protein